eukprot:g8649.t1
MSLSVTDALPLMQYAVKRGALQDAIKHGERCSINLSIPMTSLSFDEVLSEGAESRVYKGSYHGKQVAIKKAFIRTTQDLERFRAELRINSMLHHEHIVEVIGARVLPPNYLLVLELEGVSYYHKLHQQGQRIDWSQVIRIGMELASALSHIHSQGIIHRDLKTRNILQGKTGGSKLIDFGIARSLQDACEEGGMDTKPSGGFHKSKLVGTLEYMAPEVLLKKGHSFASDVYALAICINELATGIYPFADCTKENPDAHTVLEMGYGRQELAVAVAAEGLRPTLPRDCPVIFTDLINACWKLDPVSRPTLDQIYNQFHSMYSSLEELKFPKVIKSASVIQQKTQGVTSIDQEVEIEWNFKLKPIQYCPVITPGVFATAGVRGEDRMEDRHLIKPQFQHPQTSLFCIFDGHRGPEAAIYTQQNLTPILSEKLGSETMISGALQGTFLELERGFEATDKAQIAEPRGTRFPGCTALLALFLQDQLFIANAGDCRAVLCRNSAALQLTRDHNANDIQERHRVEQTEVEVAWRCGSWRIGETGIQVTRSLGDVDLKPEVVVAEPEVSVWSLSPADEFLVLATDGLWDVLTNEEVVRLVQDTVKEPDLCSKRLAMEALTRGSQDNITVIVVFLKAVSTLERIFVDGTVKYQEALPTKTTLRNIIAADEISEVL